MNSWVYLFASILVLAAGPLLYRMMATQRSLLVVLDGFIFVAIGGLVLLEVVPEAVEHGGGLALLFVLAGLLGPSLIERGFHRVARQMHVATLVLAVIGLLLHSMADGAALLPSAGQGTASLALAVLLHRIPVALTVWWLLRPSFGRAVAITALVMLGIGTAAGFALGWQHSAWFESRHFAWFQALVAGSVLHVVFNRPHIDHASTEQWVERSGKGWIEGLGNLAGLLVVVMLISQHLGEGGHNHGGMLENALHVFVDLAVQTAPALLLAYFIGGLLAEYMPESSVRWLRSGSSLGQAGRGVAVGLPLPICSCGVVPLYRSLVQRGAPPTAAMAFLIATPELGLDALLISVPLLGGDMTIARIFAAIFVALFVGWFVGRRIKNQQPASAQSACCSGAETVKPQGKQRFALAMRQGFGELVDSTAAWILLGLVIAAFCAPLVDSLPFDQWSPTLQVLLFAMLGMPLYVCAVGATPIAAVLLVAGVSPGAVIAFLLTGPATNITTFGVLANLHGRRAAIIFALSTAVLAITAGLVVNLFVGSIDLLSSVDAQHEHGYAWWQLAALFTLAALYLFAMLRRGARSFFAELWSQNEPHQHTH